jgi:hypothetical protein
MSTAKTSFLIPQSYITVRLMENLHEEPESTAELPNNGTIGNDVWITLVTQKLYTPHPNPHCGSCFMGISAA